jgi:hypothetical protein
MNESLRAGFFCTALVPRERQQQLAAVTLTTTRIVAILLHLYTLFISERISSSRRVNIRQSATESGKAVRKARGLHKTSSGSPRFIWGWLFACYSYRKALIILPEIVTALVAVYLGHVTVSIPDKPVTRPNAGNRLRLRAKTARLRFLETDVTTEEHNQIMEYCLRNKVSVSQFLADLILEDAATAKTRKAAVRIDDLEFPAETYDKLELLVHLYKKNSVSELIHDLLQPHLELQRLHIPGETRSLRLYLSDREHETVTKYMASRGITARKYVSFLALKAVAKSRKGRK